MVTDQNEVSDNAHRAHDDRIVNCLNWLVPSSISVEFLIAVPAKIFSCPKCKQSHKCANHTLNFNVHNKSCHKFAPKGNANVQRAPKHFPYKFSIFFSFFVYTTKLIYEFIAASNNNFIIVRVGLMPRFAFGFSRLYLFLAQFYFWASFAWPELRVIPRVLLIARRISFITRRLRVICIWKSLNYWES